MAGGAVHVAPVAGRLVRVTIGGVLASQRSMTTTAEPGGVRRLARFEWAAWLLLVAALIWWRWPVLKGYAYRLTGVEAEASAIPWGTDVDAALAEARRTGRPVLVDFTASWCPPCVAMKHDVWTDDEVERKVASRFVPVMVDIDRDPATSGRYQVASIPTVLVLDGGGRVTFRSGFMTPGDVIALADAH
jgi:thiol:disulfide interchange protein